MYIGLGQGQIFNNEIAAQQECGWMRIWRNFANAEGSDAASNFWQAGVEAKSGN